MKQLLIALLFVTVSLNTFTPVKVHASVGGTGGYTEVSGLLAKAIQISQYGVQQVTNAMTIAMKIKQLVTDPMTALFGANAGKQIEAQTRKWLAGGLQSDPLLIQNPEAYLKNIQTNAMRQQINLLDANKNKSAATEGIIISLVKQRRAELNPGPAEPKDLGPQTTQSALCDNQGEGITALLEKNGPIELGQNSQFNQMYTDLCFGDPNTDPALQKKLTAISASNSYFTWDNWLLTTVGGNNDYTRKMQTQLEVNRRLAEKVALADKETNKGYLNDKKCIEYETDTAEDGQPLPGNPQVCKTWQVLKPSDTVAGIAEQLDVNNLLKPLFTATKETNLATDALSGIKDVFSGLQQAAGAIQDVGALANQVGQLRANINTLTGAFSSFGGSGGNPNSANSPYINYLGTGTTNYSSVGQRTYVNTSTVASSSQVSDGATPEQLAATINPLKDQLTEHQGAMTRLSTLISQSDSYINQYQSFLSTATACTQDIRNSSGYNAQSDQPRVDDFNARIDGKKTDMLNPLLNKVTATKAKITVTNTFLTNTLNSLVGVKNISYVINLFQAYKDAISGGVILPQDIDTQVDIILKEKTPDLQKDMDGSIDAYNNNSSLKYLISECQSYLGQVNSR